MNKKTVTIFLAFFFALNVFLTSNLSAAQLNAEQINAIVNMLRVFGADASVVMQVQQTLNSSGTSYSGQAQVSGSFNNYSGQASYAAANSYAGVNSCPNLHRTLYKGMKGSDVRALQEFLKSTGDYSYPEITGYYGAATEAAVKRFQARFGIVAYGTPSSTGYGVVGPATKAKIRSVCSDEARKNSELARNFFVTPKAGSLPFLAALSFEYTGSNCTSFTVDWGDGSKPFVQYANSSYCDDYIVKKTIKHTYVKEGEFTVILSVNKPGRSKTYFAKVNAGKISANHFDVSPTSGDAPLLVGLSFTTDTACSAYKIEWGDGSEESGGAENSVSADCEPKVETVARTYKYSQPGDYTFRLYLGSGNDLSVVEQRQIYVKSGAASSSSYDSTSISVSPTFGTSPVITHVNIKGNDCTSYFVDWGDGTSVQQFEADNTGDCNSVTDKEFVHSYFIPGTYTLKVKAGSGALSALTPEYHNIIVNSK